MDIQPAQNKTKTVATLWQRVVVFTIDISTLRKAYNVAQSQQLSLALHLDGIETLVTTSTR